MTWYDSDFKQRQPIALDALTGDGSVQTKELQFTVPSEWDLFWNNIRSDMFDVVPVDVNGDLLPFKRSSANFSTRTLTIQVQAHDCKTQAINFIYLYFQNASASNLATSFSVSSPITGYIDLSRAGGFVVKNGLNQPATQMPIKSFMKSTDDVIDVYFSTAGLFRKMASPYNSRLGYEGISYVSVQSLDNTGTDSSARYDEDKTRFINGYVKARTKAGSDGTDYAFMVTVATSIGQVIDIRCLIQVRNQLPE